MTIRDFDKEWYEKVHLTIIQKMVLYSLIPYIDLVSTVAMLRIRQAFDSSCTVFICCRRNG